MNRDRLTLLKCVVLALTLPACCGLVGCNGSDTAEPLETIKVTGNVTLDGQPLPECDIVLEGDGQTAGGPITAGKFAFESTIGKRKVMISKFKEYGEADGTGMRPAKQIISEKYNTTSTLEATVTKDGPNNFDFKLTK